MERESPDEVRHFLFKQPGLNFEVWTLTDTPGELKKIETATEFLHNNREHENTGRNI